MKTLSALIAESSVVAVSAFCIFRLFQSGSLSVPAIGSQLSQEYEHDGVASAFSSLLFLLYNGAWLWLWVFSIYGCAALAAIAALFTSRLDQLHFFCKVYASSVGSMCASLAIVDTFQVANFYSLSFHWVEFRVPVMLIGIALAVVDFRFNAKRLVQEYCLAYEAMAILNFLLVSYFTWSSALCSYRTIYHVSTASLLMLARFHIGPPRPNEESELTKRLLRCVLLDLCLLEWLYAWLYTAKYL